MIKPLVFSANDKAKERGPVPLSFPSSPPAQQPPSVTKHSLPPLQFPQTPPQPQKHTPQPTPLFGAPGGGATSHVIDTFKERYGAVLYNQHKLKIELYAGRLLPLRVDAVSAWGTKTLERMRAVSTEATKLISLFSSTDCNGVLEKVADAMVPTRGLLGRIKSQDPSVYAPTLAAMQTSVQMWLSQLPALIDKAKAASFDVMIKSAMLTTVHETVGDPPDANLSQLLHNRRILLQQGSLQAEMVVKQLEDVYQQLIDLQMRFDQVLNITIPAFQASRARK